MEAIHNSAETFAEAPESDNHAYLQDRTHEITTRVRELLHRPLGAAALRIEQAADSLYPLREHLREFYSGYHIPYAYADIPPNFFEGEPINFADQASFDAHMQNFWLRDESRYEYAFDADRLSEKRKSIITAGLQRRFFENATPIDWSGWPDYSQHALQLSVGDNTMILNSLYTSISYRSAKNSGFFDCATGQHESSLVMRTCAAVHDNGVGSIMHIPVVLGDVSLSRRLMNAATLMIQYIDADRRLYDDLERLLQNDEHRAFFSKHVQRATPDGGTREANYGAARLQLMAQEGVQTEAGAMSFLLAEVPASYDGSKKMFVNDIVEQNMVDKLARLAPFGLIGPAGFFGRYIPGLLYAEDGRKLRFTTDGIEALAVFSKLVEAEFAKLWQIYDASTDPAAKIPIQAGRRCPFMGKIRNVDNPHAPELGTISRYSRALGKILHVFNVETENDFISARQQAKS